MPGAAKAVTTGIRSTLHDDNYRACAAYLEADLPDVPAATLLFDPQTSGGLLLGVAPAKCDDLVSDLREAGVDAACIGEVIAEQRIKFA